MATVTNDLDLWLDLVPVMDQDGDFDFGIWIEEIPLLEQATAAAAAARRRVEIF